MPFFLSVSAFSDIKFKIAFAAWWTVLTIIYTIALADFGVALQMALTDAVISNILLAATCLLISNNLRYYLPQNERYWYVLIISLALSATWLFLSKGILSYLFSFDNNYITLLQQSVILRYGIAFLMVACMAMMSLTWYTRQEQLESDQRNRDAEQLAKDAELYKLRQQLQPHFLFNSLNSISALTGSQPEKARHMIQQLSDFLRGTLRKDEMTWTTLEEELLHLQLYLDIEKVRFGYRLTTNISMKEDVVKMKLPSMLMQPIVENAIKFGLYNTIGAVTIQIKAKRVADGLEIEVTNPFDLDAIPALHGTGFGLSSVQRRLFLLFARHDLVQTATVDNNFITTVTIPQMPVKNSIDQNESSNHR